MTSPEVPAIAPWGKWDKAALQGILGAGALVAALMLVVSVVSIVSELASGDRLLTLAVDQPLTVAGAGSAELVEGRYESATALVSGLSPTASALLTAGDVVGLLSTTLVSVAFLYLVWRLLRREPFLRSLTWTFVAAGAVLLVGSIVGQLLSGIGDAMATSELGIDLDGEAFFSMSFDAAPIGLAFILMLVASAFEYAQKLSAETRGLV